MLSTNWHSSKHSFYNNLHDYIVTPWSGSDQVGPHVVVFGSASPDYEAIALAFGASHVTTIGVWMFYGLFYICMQHMDRIIFISLFVINFFLCAFSFALVYCYFFSIRKSIHLFSFDFTSNEVCPLTSNGTTPTCHDIRLNSTTEYNKLTYDHPKITTVTPADLVVPKGSLLLNYCWVACE